MKKPNKKNTPKTLSGQRGKSQKTSKSNDTPLSKGLIVLSYLYDRTMKGKTANAFDSFNQNLDTSFRTHISILCHKFGLEIPRRYVKNSSTGTWYKEYWLSNNDIIKVKKILGKKVNNG